MCTEQGPLCLPGAQRPPTDPLGRRLARSREDNKTPETRVQGAGRRNWEGGVPGSQYQESSRKITGGTEGSNFMWPPAGLGPRNVPQPARTGFSPAGCPSTALSWPQKLNRSTSWFLSPSLPLLSALTFQFPLLIVMFH